MGELASHKLVHVSNQQPFDSLSRTLSSLSPRNPNTLQSSSTNVALTQWGRSHEWGARKPWGNLENLKESLLNNAASRPRGHYFMFLNPRTSLSPLHKFGSKSKATSMESRHRFITSETRRLSSSFPCCPGARPYPRFITTAPGQIQHKPQTEKNGVKWLT